MTYTTEAKYIRILLKQNQVEILQVVTHSEKLNLKLSCNVLNHLTQDNIIIIVLQAIINFIQNPY